ncbi:MAG: hypothetical protein HY900_21355 [Deltaproteobacteria bacterium]|nr:hypothetical protein [Deltaproteobacteria bacterium]
MNRFAQARESHGRIAALLLALSLLLGVAAAASGAPSDEGLLNRAHPKVQEAISVQEEVTPSLMESEDVLGTAVGLNEAGEVALVVYVNQEGRHTADVLRALPRGIGGVPVTPHLTEPFRALLKPDAARVSHKVKQTPPVKLGTSGGWAYDLANGYCCGGTLGALVQKSDGSQYVLSNYHVLEADIVAGGNGTVATSGDAILQPALIDVGCDARNAQTVAALVVSSSLPAGNVDASIAQVAPGMVDAEGSILEIGTISASTTSASLNQAVKKSGRTTGLTRSKVTGLNATVNVSYDDECAGATAFTKTFRNQLVLANRGSKFLAGGDSGSVMVEDFATNPKAVGLLFAGSNTSAIANPIAEVLGYFGVTMVGK